MTCKDNIIYRVTGITGSYRAKLLPYDSDKSSAVALGPCVLQSIWASQIQSALLPLVCFYECSDITAQELLLLPHGSLSYHLMFCVSSTYPVQNKCKLLHFLG